MRSNGNCRGISYWEYERTGNTATAVPVTVYNPESIGRRGSPLPSARSTIRSSRFGDSRIETGYRATSNPRFSRSAFRRGIWSRKNERRRRKEKRGGGRSGSRGTETGRRRRRRKKRKKRGAWRCEEEERIGIAAAVETRFTVVVEPIDT